MKGKVVPDEYDERTFCAYDSDASTAYGLSAFGLLLLSQAVVSAATRCLCFVSRWYGMGLAPRAVVRGSAPFRDRSLSRIGSVYVAFWKVTLKYTLDGPKCTLSRIKRDSDVPT
ncbi:hypothetical protein GW17_00000994 [Ensete ventricosum]|nr:hypothetical protein GW17_00000994 [Ensete ventricosum]